MRVVRWPLNTATTSVTSVTKSKTLVTGLPSVTGRHGGCSLVKGGPIDKIVKVTPSPR